MGTRRSHHRRQARRTLLWMVVFVVLAQAGVGWFLNTSGWRIRFAEMAGVLDKWRSAGASDVVAFGTSRNGAALPDETVRSMLDEDESTHGVRFVNACISCGDFYVMDRLLTRAEEERLPLPRLLLLEVSPELLAGCRFWSYRMNAVRQFTWQEAWDERQEILRSGDVQRAVTAQLSPLFVHRRALRNACWQALGSLRTGTSASAAPLSDRRFQFADPAPSAPLPAESPVAALPVSFSKGSGSSNPKPEAASVAEPPRVPAERFTTRETRWLNDYRINADAAATLKRLLHRCREHDIAVVLVHPAHRSDWRRLPTPEIHRLFADFVADLEAEKLCRFVDLQDVVSDDRFHDTIHVDPPGGRQYSNAVVESIIRPLWKQPGTGSAPE